MTREKHHRRTPLASGALALALTLALTLTMAASMAEAQTDACRNSGATRAGILEATLNGTMTSTPSGGDLVIGIPERSEVNRWSLTHSSDPSDNTTTTYPVIDASTNAIVVPAGMVALVWLDIQPPTSAPGTPTMPTEIALKTAIPQNGYEPVALGITANDYRGGNSETLYRVIFCIDNQQNPRTHSWSFGLLINGDWYDPQIKNLGSGT